MDPAGSIDDRAVVAQVGDEIFLRPASQARDVGVDAVSSDHEVEGVMYALLKRHLHSILRWVREVMESAKMWVQSSVRSSTVAS